MYVAAPGDDSGGVIGFVSSDGSCGSGGIDGRDSAGRVNAFDLKCIELQLGIAPSTLGVVRVGYLNGSRSQRQP